ncbi:MAG TPA: flagellar hook capping protein [Clostridiaceae bacterium]|nr:flagellar hook capping protein [Clostridiaceae bacterium]
MNTQAVYGSTTSYVQGNADTTRSRKPGDLGKDDFLNLLVTQLKYQDPLNPMEDKEFVAQLAQFTALEQMYNLNGSLSAVKAFSLIGKHITAEFIDDTTKELKVVQGVVQSVKVSSGEIYAVVDEVDVPVDKVIEVKDVKVIDAVEESEVSL